MECCVVLGQEKIRFGCLSGWKLFSISEVFLAYSHGRTLPPEATGIMSDCDQLDDNGRENLRLFLKSALSC